MDKILASNKNVIYKFKPHQAVVILMGDPYIDYHSNKWIDLRPDLVGTIGKVQNIVGAYSQPSYKLYSDNTTLNGLWFSENRLRKLTLLEKLILWLK